MKQLIKMILKILVSSLLITLFIGIHPLQVSATNYSSPCTAVSLAPIDGVYEILPKYDANGVLSTNRECIHNFTKRSAKQNIEP